ncbi:Amidohydrolase 2 [Fusarium sp. Ph1]|nr:Amidohydrolase 2 [Fusarium sp. Ph1]
MVKLHIFLFVACAANVLSKQWNNTGKGSILLEESFSLDYPELDRTIGSALPGQTYNDLLNNLADIYSQRVSWMNEAGVDYMVLSLTSPGIQGISNIELAEEVATRANNEIAAAISNNTVRFGAFAALSMHNATQAALELRRCVEDLGFHGALLNDFQQAGADNNTLHFYDSPEYDPFWQMAVDLDVPIYLHPRPPTALINRLDFAHAPWILGPSHQFAVTLSNHVAGLCTNGVFDRFPSLKVIVGHMGERLPSDFWRIDEMLARRVPEGMPMKRPFSSYWRTNIWETTSGNFWTELLDFHRSVLGEDRILYSVDYPFVMMQQGAEWIESLHQNRSTKLDFIRNHAIKILKLDA